MIFDHDTQGAEYGAMVYHDRSDGYVLGSLEGWRDAVTNSAQSSRFTRDTELQLAVIRLFQCARECERRGILTEELR